CRTDLDYVTPTGSTAMRFDHNTFAVFDLHILQRTNAEAAYSQEDRAIAAALYAGMSGQEIADLTRNIASALPGSTTEPL
ncbi:mannonate dehydratase, partial [Escherichia coli]|uniref:mannonate dehydratase n=2 Tax=Pseudomonadota TaxID=1224 RepID=UPI003CFA74E2